MQNKYSVITPQELANMKFLPLSDINFFSEIHKKTAALAFVEYLKSVNEDPAFFSVIYTPDIRASKLTYVLYYVAPQQGVTNTNFEIQKRGTITYDLFNKRVEFTPEN